MHMSLQVHVKFLADDQSGFSLIIRWCQVNVLICRISSNAVVNCFIRCESKNKSKLWWLVDSPHEGPVMQKMFPCHHVFMRARWFKRGSHTGIRLLYEGITMWHNVWLGFLQTLTVDAYKWGIGLLADFCELKGTAIFQRCRFCIVLFYCLFYFLYPERYGYDFKCSIFKHNLVIDIFNIFSEIGLWWMPQDYIYDKSALVRAMAWYYRATSHYLNKC